MTLKPLAQVEIENAQALGEIIRLHIITTENQNLPKAFSPMSVIAIDVLPNRPLNLIYDEDCLSIDLCFSAPPQRCVFRWEDIVAVSSRVNGKEYLKPCQTTIKYLLYSDEDNFITLVESKESATIVQLVVDKINHTAPEEKEIVRGKRHLSIVK